MEEGEEAPYIEAVFLGGCLCRSGEGREHVVVVVVVAGGGEICCFFSCCCALRF